MHTIRSVCAAIMAKVFDSIRQVFIDDTIEVGTFFFGSFNESCLVVSCAKVFINWFIECASGITASVIHVVPVAAAVINRVATCTGRVIMDVDILCRCLTITDNGLIVLECVIEEQTGIGIIVLCRVAVAEAAEEIKGDI